MAKRAKRIVYIVASQNPLDVDDQKKRYESLFDDVIREEEKKFKVGGTKECHVMRAAVSAYIAGRFKEDELDENVNKIKIFLRGRERLFWIVPFVNDDLQQTRQPLLAMKTGANYEMAKIIASCTDSHLITDMAYRWKEVELDRSEYGITQGHWNSFSKAFQNLEMKFLNNVPLEFAFELRKKDHLTSIRLFLSRIWHNCVTENMFENVNQNILQDELLHQIKEAEREWSKINKELAKRLGLWSSAIVGILPQVVSGSAEFLIGSLAINGLTQLGVSLHEKHNFSMKYPASFFLRLKKAIGN